MTSDAALSALITQAVQDQNFDLVVDAMSEKVDLERALHTSRDDGWNTWYQQQTGGTE